MPLMVHSIWRAPLRIAASEFATARPEVVVAMRAPDDVVGARDVLAHVREHPAVLLGNRVAGGVGQVDDGGAGANHLGAHLNHEVPIAARRVLARELDVVEMLLRVRDRPGRRVEDVLARHVELVLQMDVGGRDEDVDARMLRLVDRAQRRNRHPPRGCARGSARPARSPSPRRAERDSKSPGDDAAKPASMMSTLSRSSWRAIAIFSSTFMVQPGDCSPSRSVVSKIRT